MINFMTAAMKEAQVDVVPIPLRRLGLQEFVDKVFNV